MGFDCRGAEAVAGSAHRCRHRMGAEVGPVGSGLHTAQAGADVRIVGECRRRIVMNTRLAAGTPGADRASSRDMTAPDSTAKIRLLIAEDDDNARALLVDLLTTMGHSIVAEVSTGREAFERAKDVAPDVVLLDVHMPDGSGIEAAEKITQTIPGVAVVLFSGDQTLTLSERDVTATAAIAFLPKPAPPRILDSTIRLAAQRARERAHAKQDADAARTALEHRKTIERAKGILI